MKLTKNLLPIAGTRQYTLKHAHGGGQMRNFGLTLAVALVVGLFAGTLLPQDAWAECDFLPVGSVSCPASLSPQEAAFCGIWGEGYSEFGGGQQPVCLAAETVDGKTTIWLAYGEHTTLAWARGVVRTAEAQIKGEIMTASYPTERGTVTVEFRRDSDVLRLKWARRNRRSGEKVTNLTTLPRFGK